MVDWLHHAGLEVRQNIMVEENCSIHSNWEAVSVWGEPGTKCNLHGHILSDLISSNHTSPVDSYHLVFQLIIIELLTINKLIIPIKLLIHEMN